MSKVTTVRYGRMRTRALFSVDTRDEIQPGDVCVVRTSRGEELGTVLARPIGRDEDPEEAREEGEGKVGCTDGACGSCASPRGRIVRRARPEETTEQRTLDRAGTRDEIQRSRAVIRDLGLDIRVVDAEYLFQKRKLVVYYTSSSRIDPKALVSRLAKEFDSRIELMQVGARDEARLVGDMASCGRELCCRTFLHDLQPVSMRMAKQQKKTLDPTKIAGQCGKLKCCLRYEDEVYVELGKTVPKRGSWVKFGSDEKVARVISSDLLLQKVVVDVRGKREIVTVSELLETGLAPPQEPPPRPPKKVKPLKVRPKSERPAARTEPPVAPESSDERSAPASTPDGSEAGGGPRRTWRRAAEADDVVIAEVPEEEADAPAGDAGGGDESPGSDSEARDGESTSEERRPRRRRRRSGRRTERSEEKPGEAGRAPRARSDAGAPVAGDEANSENRPPRRRRRTRGGDDDSSTSVEDASQTGESSGRSEREERPGESGDKGGVPPRRRRRSRGRRGGGAGGASGQASSGEAPPPSGDSSSAGDGGSASSSGDGARSPRRRRRRGRRGGRTGGSGSAPSGGSDAS